MIHGPDTGLYPARDPYTTGRLALDGGHEMHFEQSGNPNGLPVLYLHGGPGAGSTPQQRAYFNPETFRIVMFDQRGSGRSTPYGETHANTTRDLVADIERLRLHLGVDRWLVAGGSWGATLALAYGVEHPGACLGFILRGVFLATRAEVDWFLAGMRQFFPEAHATFAAHVAEPNARLGPREILDAYAKLLFDPDPERHMPAARAWARYESACSTLIPGTSSAKGRAFDHYALSLARLEAHYFLNEMFLGEDELMAKLGAIRALPAVIVQGRYDVVCPIASAHRLHLAWPNSELVTVPDAGHSGMEPGIARAIRHAADVLARDLSAQHR
ncbi:MAG: prolyl aminopeptidase [Alphaproteobacteria bacterium]|nr:prolyl aminopeptidase [Alphaproteobacteria bacterium]